MVAARWTLSSILSLGLVLLQTGVGNASPTPNSLSDAGSPRTLVPRVLDNLNQDVQAMVNALETMQSQFFNGNLWPTAIDWTAATLSTQVSATLSVLDSLPSYALPAWNVTSLISTYFPNIVAFYSAENYQAVLNEAYDDMQWVALEWLEAIKFINLYGSAADRQYIPEFAQRANQFYQAASVGYDTTLCGGGMLWNPRLLPYKNAITNELYVASSIGMYLYFPGDNTTSPPTAGHQRLYLENAIKTYNWLKGVNLTNAQGLYVDGYHIAGYQNASDPGTAMCDQRSEDLYTYNQGVILSGFRGLWQATGEQMYLEDGYRLIAAVINATGFGASNATQWYGMGNGGILQDVCDASGTCSQDNQDFKGIYFHHMTLFCMPLSIEIRQQGPHPANTEQEAVHNAMCSSYRPWIQLNAQAAWATRNNSGAIGGFWGAGSSLPQPTLQERIGNPANKSDIWNHGVPNNSKWRKPNSNFVTPGSMIGIAPHVNAAAVDPNTLGRGRTVETQAGGLAVLRALVVSEEGRESP